MKYKIYLLLEKGDRDNIWSRITDRFIIGLILLNVIALVLESLGDLHAQYYDLFTWFNIISVAIFSVEYLLRLYVSEYSHPSANKAVSAFKYIFSFYGMIDLLSIIPFYMPFITSIDLKFLRILRVTRALKIFKLNRYNDSMNLILEVITEKKSELAVTGFLTSMVLLISAFTMYYIEGPAQPEQFPNVLASLWWAVATLTTVGYGDIYPITGVGKIISSIIAVMGIGLVALPTGLIGAGFMNKIERKDICPHCKKHIE